MVVSAKLLAPKPIENGTRNAYMWSPSAITVEIEDIEGRVWIVQIITPVGMIEIIGEFDYDPARRTLRVSETHVQGLHSGALGRAGLSLIGRKLLDEADVEEIIIEGGTRTTGARPSRRPPPFRICRSPFRICRC
jgi:hypothetical protein